MSAGHSLVLDEYYAALETRWTTVREAGNASLVVPNGNSGAAVHRWFRMKEAYSCDLVDAVLDGVKVTREERVSACDPFAGSGTTGVSLAQAVSRGRIRAASFTGLETNPFLHLVSRAKLRSLVEPPADFDRLAQRVGAIVKKGEVEPAPLPGLTTFADNRFFTPGVLDELLMLRAAIDSEAMNGSSATALDLARLCLGACVEPCSRLRRDGRALRYEPDKSATRPLSEFLTRADEVQDDLGTATDTFTANVYEIDARTTREELAGAGPFSLILFSPPYPNNIDYTEVYKLEAWLLGLYGDQDAFREQRRRTVRSHASLDFGDMPLGLSAEHQSLVDTLIDPVVRAAEGKSRYSASRRRTIRGYAYDMLETLQGLARVSRAGAHLVYVVGNSLHGGRDDIPVLIAADLVIARLAEIAGFEVDRIEIARTPARRAALSPFLRESIVFARRSTKDDASA